VLKALQEAKTTRNLVKETTPALKQLSKSGFSESMATIEWKGTKIVDVLAKQVAWLDVVRHESAVGLPIAQYTPA